MRPATCWSKLIGAPVFVPVKVKRATFRQRKLCTKYFWFILETTHEDLYVTIAYVELSHCEKIAFEVFEALHFSARRTERILKKIFMKRNSSCKNRTFYDLCK